MKARWLVLLGAVAVLTFLAWFRPPAPGRLMSGTDSPPTASGAAQTAPNAGFQALAGGPPAETSHLADGLDAPGGNIHADLRILDGIFAQYRSATHGLNPVGENREITAALTGRNPLGFAFLPRVHPALNKAGELCDRWGTPFFFHQLAGDRMEIRSAGPDRRLWTADDQVLTP